MSKKTKNRGTKKSKSTKKGFSNSFVVIGIVIALAGIWGASEYYSAYQQDTLVKSSKQSGVYQGVSGLHRAKFEQSNYRYREKKDVIDPMRYRTQKQILSYSVAQRIPQALDQLYCFCGCAQSIKHKSLLSCFTDDHGSNCGICMDQALMADKMLKKGRSVIEIADAMDNKFS